MTLLLLDTAVREYETILAAAQPAVTTVLFDRAVDSFESLKRKIASAGPVQTVGIVQHGSGALPYYKMLETQATPATVTDAEQSDPSLCSWSELIDFYSFLKAQGAQTIDLISCSLYSNAGWVYVLQQLEQRLALDFRASINDTGNVASGGDWIQESDGVNIQDIYFTQDISKYTNLLNVAFSGATHRMAVAPNATIGSFVLKGGVTSSIPISATSLPDLMVVREAVKGNVIVNWGDTSYGNTSASSGTTIVSNSGIVAIQTGSFAAAYLKSDGTVSSWGNSGAGGSASIAALASSGSPVTAITSFGNQNTALTYEQGFSALREDGSVFFFGGSGTASVIGLGPNSHGMVSVANSGSPVVSIAATGFAFAGLREDGSVSAWGYSSNGGSNTSAGPANSGSPVVALAATFRAFAALRSNGSVYAWGSSFDGGNAASAAQANSGSPVVSITASSAAVAALRQNGTVYAWGDSFYGGNNTLAALASSGSPVTHIAYTSSAFAALRQNGSVYVWGNTSGGGSNSQASLANASSPVVALAATSGSLSGAFAALRQDGTVYAWGASASGGSGSWGNNSVVIPASSGSPVVAIASTQFAFAALRQDGTVYSWGGTSVGGGSMRITSGSPVISISSTSTSFTALRANGTVFAWGDSSFNAGNNTAAQNAGSSGVISLTAGLAGMNSLRSTNPTPASASQALTDDLFGNYIYWSTDSTNTVTINCRSAINGLSGATQTTAMIDYIRTMAERVNSSKYTIPSSQLSAFKSTVLSGVANMQRTFDIDQYFPTINGRNSAAALEINSFITDSSKYICIELPINIPTVLYENGSPVKTLFFDGTNVRDGNNGSASIIAAGTNLTLGTKSISKIAIGSLIGYGGGPAPPATPIPSPARPVVRSNTSMSFFWTMSTLELLSGFTLTLRGDESPIIQNLGADAREYTFTGLTPNTTYTLEMYSTNGTDNVNSALAYFNPAEACSPPSAPSTVSFTPVSPNSLTVSWTTPGSLNGGAIQGYVIYDTLSAGGRYPVNGTRPPRYGVEAWRNTYTILGIAPGSYKFGIAAFNAAGYGTLEVDATTKTFPA